MNKSFLRPRFSPRFGISIVIVKVIVKVEGAKRLPPHAAQTDLLYIQRRHSLTPSMLHYARHSWVYPHHNDLLVDQG